MACCIAHALIDAEQVSSSAMALVFIYGSYHSCRCYENKKKKNQQRK